MAVGLTERPLLGRKLTSQGHRTRTRTETAGTAWKDAASAKYRYTSAPFALDHKDGLYVVTSRLTGNFPGSPLELRYLFRLERGKIAQLEIIP